MKKVIIYNTYSYCFDQSAFILLKRDRYSKVIYFNSMFPFVHVENFQNTLIK